MRKRAAKTPVADRRIHRRRPVAKSVRCDVDLAGKRRHLNVDDVSRRGMRLHGPVNSLYDELSAGDKAHLRALAGEDLAGPGGLEAEVVWAARAGEALMLGLKFVEDLPEDILIFMDPQGEA